MKMLFRIRKPITLLLCAALLITLCACSLDGIAASGKKSEAGKDFISLSDPSQIKDISIDYTSVMTETVTETISNQDTIKSLCQAFTSAVDGKKSVAWNEMTDKVDGGEGYVFTLNFTDGTNAKMGFLLNPTKGYLTLTVNDGNTLYFQVGEAALENLASFYPA